MGPLPERSTELFCVVAHLAGAEHLEGETAGRVTTTDEHEE